MRNFFKKTWVGNVSAIIAGAAFTLAFAPFSIFPIAIICPAILYALWVYRTPRNAAFRGFLFGLGFFGTSVHWVYISMNTFGGIPPIIAGIFTAGFVAILSLYPALNGFVLNRYFPKNDVTKVFFAFPALWVFFEWLRGLLFTGFPWVFIGTSQVNSPLKGFAPILSVYGVSLFTVSTAAIVYSIVDEWQSKHYKKIFAHLFTFAFLWIIAGTLSLIHWTQPFGKPIKVSLIQGNIPQQLKWNADQVTPTLSRYVSFTQDHWDSKIIVWPEAAIPMSLQDAQSFVNNLDLEAKKHHSSIITGVPVAVDFSSNYYNSVIMIGDGTGIYAKRRLVPFGEYVPFEKLFGKVFDLLQVPMSEFVPGPFIPKPLAIDQLKIGTYICYEIAYPEQVLRNSFKVNLVVTVSNDAWFGESVAQAQHLEMGQMRAMEIGRPILFVSNSGLTAIIDSLGHITAEAPPYQTYVLTGLVQPTTGSTPLQATSLIALFAILIVFLWMARKGQLHGEKPSTEPQPLKKKPKK